LWFCHQGVNNHWGGIFCKRQNSNIQAFALFMPPQGTQVEFEISTGSLQRGLNFGSFTVNETEFISVEREGTTIRAYRNGALVDSRTDFVGAVRQISAPFEIGRIDYNQNASWSNCMIDELRVTKGVARYKGTHVIPTEPFPNA